MFQTKKTTRKMNLIAFLTLCVATTVSAGPLRLAGSTKNFGDNKLNPDSTDNTRESGKNPKIIELLTSGKAEAVPNPLDIEDPNNAHFFKLRKEIVKFTKAPSIDLDNWGTTLLGDKPNYDKNPDTDPNNNNKNEFVFDVKDLSFQTVNNKGEQLTVQYDDAVADALKKYIESVSHDDDESKSKFTAAPTQPGKDYECFLDKHSGKQQCKFTGSDNIDADVSDVPDVNDRTKRYVFRADDRSRVNSYSDSSNWPYRAAGRVGNHCSGTLIGPGYVLTAGHCVHEGPSGKWFSDLSFKPGHSSERATANPYGSYSWCRATTVTAWTIDGKASADYALIELCDKPSFYMAFGYSSSMSSSWSMNFNGYPGSTRWSKQYNHYGSLRSVSSDYFTYRGGLDSVKGTSGSGVYLYKSSTGSRVVYGINNWQYCYGSDAKSCTDYYGSGHTADSYNHAVRINSSRFSRLCGWMPGRC